MRAAIYARVSTADQTVANQLDELRRYAAARGWSAVEEFVDAGISGSTTSRPALNRLLLAARRRQVDVVIVWALDRLGRNLQHLIATIADLETVGVRFVSLHEGIDATTAAGRLQLHVIGALAEFERSRIVERVHAGLARARREGKRIGRPRTQLPFAGLARTAHLGVRDAARELDITVGQLRRWRHQARKVGRLAA